MKQSNKLKQKNWHQYKRQIRISYLFVLHIITFTEFSSQTYTRKHFMKIFIRLLHCSLKSHQKKYLESILEGVSECVERTRGTRKRNVCSCYIWWHECLTPLLQQKPRETSPRINVEDRQTSRRCESWGDLFCLSWISREKCVYRRCVLSLSYKVHEYINTWD